MTSPTMCHGNDVAKTSQPKTRGDEDQEGWQDWQPPSSANSTANPRRSLPLNLSHASSTRPRCSCPATPGGERWRAESSLPPTAQTGAWKAALGPAARQRPRDYNSQKAPRLPALPSPSCPSPRTLGVVVPPGQRTHSPPPAAPALVPLLGRKALLGCKGETNTLKPIKYFFKKTLYIYIYLYVCIKKKQNSANIFVCSKRKTGS